jgi:hypothetical protein
MLKDHNHDLIHQLSEISDSVWRIDKHYLKSSEGCQTCQKMWRKLADDYHNHIGMLTDEIKRHIKEERFE